MYGMKAQKGLSASMQAKMLADPKYLLAQELLKSSSEPPATTGIGALAKVAGMLGGAYGVSQVNDDFKARGDDYAQALSAMSSDPKVTEGVPALKDPTTGKELVPAVNPGIDSMIAILNSGKNATNPDVQEYAQQLQQRDLEGKNSMRYKLQEVYDPQSPSGTRFVSEADAMGMAGKPSKSQRISVGPDGQITIEDGVTLGTGGGKSLAKPTVNKIEEKLLDSSEAQARLKNIEASFKPEYLQYDTIFSNSLANQKDKMGMAPSPEDAVKMAEFTQFRQNAGDNLNRTIKDLTGSAMGENEAQRIINSAPNAGTGLFDGDGPTRFQAKLQNSAKLAGDAIKRMNWAKAQGLDPLKTGVELHQVPALIEREGARIESEIRAQNPGAQEEQINNAVRLRLGQIFGN